METPNWPQVIKDIRATGLTYQGIADKTGSAKVTIHDLGSGKTPDPHYTLGATLIEMQKKAGKRKVPK